MIAKTLTEFEALSIREGDRIFYDDRWLTITDVTPGVSAGGMRFMHVLAQTDDGMLRANTIVHRFTLRSVVRFACRRKAA